MTELEPEEFQRWSDIYYKASTSLENREKNVDDAAELIEKVGRLPVDVITGLARVKWVSSVWVILATYKIAFKWMENLKITVYCDRKTLKGYE